MVVEFEPNHILLSNPSQWWLCYKEEMKCLLGEFTYFAVSYIFTSLWTKFYNVLNK